MVYRVFSDYMSFDSEKQVFEEKRKKSEKEG